MNELNEEAADPCPCGGCDYLDDCAQGKACRTFTHWAEYGKVLASKARVPSVQIYRQLFEPKPRDPKREDWKRLQ